MHDTKLSEFPSASLRAPPEFDQHRIDETLAALGALKKKYVKDDDNTRRDGRSTDAKKAEWQKCHSAEMRGAALFRQFRRELPIPNGEEDYCLTGWAEWLLSQRHLWPESTWRHTRIAATYCLEKFPEPDRDQATDLINLSGQPILRTADRSVLSFLSCDDFEQLLCAARITSRGAVGPPALVDWVLAGISTALGPAEWSFTELVEHDGRTSLYVFDARAPHPGEPGSFRVLDVSQLGPERVRAIRRTSERCRQWLIDGAFTRWKFEVEQRLVDLYKQLHPATTLRCSLETLQFQAISNFATCIEAAAVSALIGDTFLGLPNLNYAHASKAWAPDSIGSVPEPDRSDVQRFRRIRASYDIHREVMNLKQARRNKQSKSRSRLVPRLRTQA
jgi:hypothetical protein